MAQVLKGVIFETRFDFRRFGVKQPRHFRKQIAEMCYLYPRTRRLFSSDVFLFFFLTGCKMFQGCYYTRGDRFVFISEFSYLF